MIPVEYIMQHLEMVAMQHRDSKEVEMTMKTLAFAFIFSSGVENINGFTGFIKSIDPDFASELRDIAMQQYKNTRDPTDQLDNGSPQ